VFPFLFVIATNNSFLWVLDSVWESCQKQPTRPQRAEIQAFTLFCVFTPTFLNFCYWAQCGRHTGGQRVYREKRAWGCTLKIVGDGELSFPSFSWRISDRCMKLLSKNVSKDKTLMRSSILEKCLIESTMLKQLEMFTLLELISSSK
jgi:hypothetical protein